MPIAVQQFQHGNPEESIKLIETSEKDPGPNELLVQLLYSPINPADINMLEGRYLEQPPLPYCPGTEGVGEVKKVGQNVTQFKEGDRVIMPFRSGGHWRGHWTSSLITDQEDCLLCPNDIDPKQAAMLLVNPLTTWCFLSQMVSLNPGDTIIQNSASSALGSCVIKWAKKKGISTINLIRNPKKINTVKSWGADHVFEDTAEAITKIKALNATIKLALNGVGGESAGRLAKCLSEKGTLLTYGAMSKAPLTVSNGQLIYKDLTFNGFNRSRWVKETKKDLVTAAYNEILDTPTAFEVTIDSTHPLSQIQSAIQRHLSNKRAGKVLLDCQK